MADKEELHRCVSNFMRDTCRYTTVEHKTWADFASFLAKVVFINTHGDVESLMSGSAAELYFKSMLPCINDIDIMVCFNQTQAIPQNHTLPVELPGQYQDRVNVVEIVNSHQPGYVHLKHSYAVRKNENGHYDIEHHDKEGEFFSLFDDFQINQIKQDFFRRTNPEIRNNPLVQSLLMPVYAPHGPAFFGKYCFSYANFDIVLCVHCLLWPPQASNWPIRNRDHSWPDQTTIDMVLSKGCDVVQAVHPLCRQDEWMRKHQWRLSFSRAEVTLLNSWTSVQQIIYHMLRFVMKCTDLTEEYNKDSNLPKLSNYHIKTLMLWECEEKPQSWWSAESSLIKLCSSLLHKLSDCVAVKHCQQYFISDCNLLDHFVHDDDASLMICIKLKSLADESVLLSWFVENYIRKCAQQCPADVSVLFEDISSGDKLQRAINVVTEWRRCTLPREVYDEHLSSEMFLLYFLQIYRTDAIETQALMKKCLHTLDAVLQDFFTALLSLRVAYTISMHSLTEDSLAILWTLFDPCTAAVDDTTNSEFDSVLCIKKAIKLACLCSVGSDALDMLHNEMSKAYLHQSLAYGQESTYSVVHVLLAALYYKSGHYQSAIDHCKQVLNQTACEQYRLRCIGAEYLPQIDETVDAVLGLILFYQHVQRSAIKCNKEEQPMIQPAFTLDLLAHYLHVHSGVRSSELSMYRRHLIETNRPLVGDILLFNAVQIQLKDGTETANVEMKIKDTEINASSSTMDTGLLVTTLEQVALEKLISVRQMMVRDLHSQQFPVLNEFEALYAYKCGLFEECLLMCRNHVDMLLQTSCPLKQRYLALHPVLVSLLDGELSSLFGIVRILHPLWVLLMHCCREYESISVLTLSVYLMVQCQKKLGNGSFDETLKLVRFVHDNYVCTDFFVDRLILRLTYRSLKLQVDDSTAAVQC